MRFCIASNNRKIVQDFKFIEKQLGSKKLFYVNDTAKGALNDILTYDLDCLFLDISLANVDPLEYIRAVKNKRKECEVIAMTNIKNELFQEQLKTYGADRCITLPVEHKGLFKEVQRLMLKGRLDETTIQNLNRIERECENGNSLKQFQIEQSLDESISNVLITIGIPPHIRGYHCLREGIKIAIRNPYVIDAVTKVLYPEIARVLNSSPSKVERAMRHAIETAWNRGSFEKMNDFLGIKGYRRGEKPTNSEFIALISDKLLLDGAF